MNSSYGFDLERMPKELKLLIEILKTTNEDHIQLTDNELLKDIDWDHFLQLTMYHRVYPLIYLKLKEQENKLIPPFVIQTLYQEYKKNTFQMLKLSGEMENISELFMENNIRPLFLKGPLLALELYGDISLRTSKDLDILIPINDFDKVEGILLNYGYERQDASIPLWKRKTHHVTYFHPKKRIILEIHWKLHANSINEPNFEDLWKRRAIRKFASYPTCFLGKEDLFLYLVAHGARHGWFRLRWLLDIQQIMNDQMNAGGNPITHKKYDYRHLVWGIDYLGQALILVSMLFHVSINKEMQPITERKGSRKLAEKSLIHLLREAQSRFIISEEYMDKYQERYFFSIKPNLQKIIFVLHLLYPSPKDAEVLPLPKFFHFIYIPLRPFLWAWRKTRKLSKI